MIAIHRPRRGRNQQVHPVTRRRTAISHVSGCRRMCYTHPPTCCVEIRRCISPSGQNQTTHLTADALHLELVEALVVRGQACDHVGQLGRVRVRPIRRVPWGGGDGHRASRARWPACFSSFSSFASSSSRAGGLARSRLLLGCGGCAVPHGGACTSLRWPRQEARQGAESTTMLRPTVAGLTTLR